MIEVEYFRMINVKYCRMIDIECCRISIFDYKCCRLPALNFVELLRIEVQFFFHFQWEIKCQGSRVNPVKREALVKE